MEHVLIIGSGISGMTCAIRCAGAGLHVTLVSPFPSERSQSVMAAGGINAVTADCEEGDSVASHIEDTLRSGEFLAGREAVSGLCGHAESVIRYLESIGTVFSLEKSGKPAKRAFGGHSHKRTYFCGSSTGKQIVSALVMETRRYEAAGMITRRLWSCFHSALIRDGVCYGALLFDERIRGLEAVYADAIVVATGGMNALFGKTTGSTQCDGYAAGKLFTQGAVLKNLEFIQYHPTTLETAQKRMLVSEALRGEGGRLYYEEKGRRVYFLEDKYGPEGNLRTRDVVTHEIVKTGKPVFLDVSFLGKDTIGRRVPEARDLCMKYGGIDITREPVPVVPSVHFFMGGLAVRLNHETNIRNLFAVGECASMYHGANRLGGNSLLAAIYSGNLAAEEIAGRKQTAQTPEFSSFIRQEQDNLERILTGSSPFPVQYIRDMLAGAMNRGMGVIRNEESLKKGLEDTDYLLSIADRIRYDSSVLPYFNYSLTGILAAARATLACALVRKESRGAHFRSDYPKKDDRFGAPTLIAYENGAYRVRQDQEGEYES